MQSLNSQIKWCRRLGLGLSIGLAASVLLFLFAGYLPARHRLEALQGQIQSKTREVEENQNKARNLPLLALEATKHLASVGRYVADHRVSRVQLAQQTNDVLLRRRVAAALLVAMLPELLDRTFAVHQTDQAVGGGRQPM